MTASLTPIGPLYLRQKLTGKRNFGRDCTFTRLDFHARFRASSHLTDPSDVKVNREVEAATDCGPVSHKVEKKEKEKAEQAETEALMDAEVEAATDCGCGCGCSKK